MNDKPAARRGIFLLVFILIVTALGIARCVNPSLTLSPIAGNAPEGQAKDSPSGREVQSPGPKAPAAAPVPDSIGRQSRHVDSLLLRPRARLTLLRPDGKPVKNRVTSVRRFETSFPDLNDVQLATAQRLGISHIENREEAVRRLKELVYVGDNPFYAVQPLHQSIPYLIPRAATLLNEIARAFNDSLVTKGYEPHKLLVTSVLRTKDDVSRLRRMNHNASENSCHQYGTTFDISYNRFLQINEDGSSEIRWVTVFKSILAEVLEDQRLGGTCYVKYEVKQSCFHITAR